jgi:hypothetical protein
MANLGKAITVMVVVVVALEELLMAMVGCRVCWAGLAASSERGLAHLFVVVCGCLSQCVCVAHV